MPTVDVMLEMLAFRNQILFSVVKGSQFTATVFNCLDVYVSNFSKETEQAVHFFITTSPAISESIIARYVSTLNMSLGVRTVSGAGPSKNVIQKLCLEARRQLYRYIANL